MRHERTPTRLAGAGAVSSPISACGKLPERKAGPCPLCAEGKDRFRFDDREGKGTWICNSVAPVTVWPGDAVHRARVRRGCLEGGRHHPQREAGEHSPEAGDNGGRAAGCTAGTVGRDEKASRVTYSTPISTAAALRWTCRRTCGSPRRSGTARAAFARPWWRWCGIAPGRRDTPPDVPAAGRRLGRQRWRNRAS